MKYEPISTDDAISLIAEGVHTGLRKGTDAPGSSAAWNAIAAKDSGWEDAVAFAIEGLEFMGFAIVKIIHPEPSSAADVSS